MTTDNPAWRLHDFLTRYQEAADPKKAIMATWASVLGVGESKVLFELAELASLIPAIDQALVAVGDNAQWNVFQRFSHKWAAPIVMYDHHPRNTPGPGRALVDDDALTALAGLASYLSLRLPAGGIPDDEHRAELRSEVEDTIRALRDDDSVPEALATAINLRMHDVLWAIDHVKFGGANAVEEATERLLGAVMIYSHSDPEARKSGPIKRVLDVASKVWIAFKLGPEAKAAIEGWQDIFDQLPPV